MKRHKHKWTYTRSTWCVVMRCMKCGEVEIA